MSDAEVLKLERVTKQFGDVLAVDDVSLEAAPGELITLLGPSGCGKTTTLRMIAGFETPSSGRIVVGGRDVTRLAPQRRGVGMVFQNYALFPHFDVFENVAFGLRVRKVARADLRDRVARALARVDLAGYEARRVQELSGGQQQRVALARALAPEPPILLLDEPLSNLDAALRERTRTELRDLLKRVAITSVFVTHDQEEAFAIADRVAVMDRGRLQQFGAPEALYRDPANEFVASFLGHTNWFAARLIAAGAGEAEVELEGAEGVRWPARLAAGAPPPSAGSPVRVMLRPEQLRIHAASSAPANALLAQTVQRRFAGALTYTTLRAAGTELVVAEPGGITAHAGDRVAVAPVAGVRPLMLAAT